MTTPKIKGLICINCDPEGCDKLVQNYIQRAEATTLKTKYKNVLILGCSTGYGLSTRIALTFGAKAHTLGVMLERAPDDKRDGSAGWYFTQSLEQHAHKKAYYAKTLNSDVFSESCKKSVAAEITQSFPEGIDLVIYSIAAPKRTMPDGGVYHSALKPIGQSYHAKSLDIFKETLSDVTIAPASDEEIAATTKVMGGEDWEAWITYLLKEKCLAPNAQTIAYSYEGPALTRPIYRDGTIGAAKQHLEKTRDAIETLLKPILGVARIAFNKALVTQASSAIPVLPLYLSLLYRVMKENHTHEDALDQMLRLCHDHLNNLDEIIIRLDDKENDVAVQTEVLKRWKMIDESHLQTLADVKGVRDDFYRLFGFTEKSC
jgi:enoyl-[acyl-carrier protein] reductase/trans-2-enoyl-CoA reductase (NAD+)